MGHRIGGEVQLRKDKQGQFEIWMRGKAPPKVVRRGSPTRPRIPSPPRVRSQSPRGRNSGPTEAFDRRRNEDEENRNRRFHEEIDRKRMKRNAPPDHSEALDFISRLPTDKYIDSEVQLRQAIIDLLQEKGVAVPLTEVCKDPKVTEYRSELLPSIIPLREWIEQRIGGEVETSKDETGRYMLAIKAGGGASKESKREKFFEDLPTDGFTHDEVQLRQALLDFLQNWKASEPPTLTNAGEDQTVKKWKMRVIPKGTPVTMRNWIDRRIGGEIELAESASSQLYFGLRGQLDLSLVPKKRGGGGEPPYKRSRGGAVPSASLVKKELSSAP